MPKKVTKKKPFTVDTGDAGCWFPYGDTFDELELEQIFERRIKGWDMELFPGLKLRDHRGQLLEPRLQAILVPAKE